MDMTGLREDSLLTRSPSMMAVKLAGSIGVSIKASRHKRELPANPSMPIAVSKATRSLMTELARAQ